jgi:hypothetical protein
MVTVETKTATLKNDLEFRRIVKGYLENFYTNGWLRGDFHEQMAQYILDVLGVEEAFGLVEGYLTVLDKIRDNLTDNLGTKIGYTRTPRLAQMKGYIDKFCDEIDKMMPELAAMVRQGERDFEHSITSAIKKRLKR